MEIGDLIWQAGKELTEDIKFKVETRYLTEDNVVALFKFGKDEIASDVQINRLTKPRLMDYYNKAVEVWVKIKNWHSLY